ncbi:hypothetical protein [Pengzhenrongella frigida]|uniref:Uncharacterized protein n=1 Tax=Pengzhenrongella frigida TaxID=1259133 RepID=A0A4V1ZGX6_9MICO|nr:hypothetical protein [Cellulomonas sp. HLT2-17]RYV50074.1 hypothetical protein EUA98_15635 [Cellulomonas sp. HLT2-17]
MTDSTRGTWGAEDLPAPPAPAQPAVSAATAGSPAPASRARRSAPGVEPDAPAPDPASKDHPTRRRNLLIAAAVGAVVIVGLGIAALAGAFDAAEPVATPSASTVTLASPTPTVAPIERTPTSAFADALPSTVLDLALTAVAPQPTLVVADALEGYRFDYSDGAAVSVALDAGQWESPEEAAVAYTALVAAAPATDSGSVEVGGAAVGSWTFSEGADGAGSVTWTNGTALFQATGPAQTVRDFYQAFPL